MRLTTKMTLALAAAILLVLGVNALVRVQREAALFESDTRHDDLLLGRALAGAVARTWVSGERGQAVDLIADANAREDEVAIRWVWLDAAEGAPDAPMVPVRRLDLARQGKAQSVRWRPRGAPIDSVVSYVPLAIDDQRVAALELSEPLTAEAAYVHRTILQAIAATIALVLITTLVAMGIGLLFVGRPVRRLVEQARRIGRGDLTRGPVPRQRDEIGQLAREMNAMCANLAEAREQLSVEIGARIAAIEQLRHADRLATVGKLAAGIAHEIGTPLNVIAGHAQLMADERPDEPAIQRNADIIVQQVQRVAKIMRQLLDFARRRVPQRSRHDLAVLARQTTSLLASLAKKRGVEVSVEVPAESVPAMVDPGQLEQAVTNLMVNGIHSMPGGGGLDVTVGRRQATPPADNGGAAGEYLYLAVRDHGGGIGPAVLPRIFEPFFTTKDVGEGTGLGLSVTYGIVSEHGGWIDVETKLGQGSCFTLYLPAAAAPVPAGELGPAAVAT